MDGSTFISERLYSSVQCRGWPIASAVSEAMHLRVRCANPNCDRQEVFDATEWTNGRGAHERLGMLEARMRCIACGGRSARLEVWSGPQPPVDPLQFGALYRFR
jgi:hypothetical protein